MRCSQVVYTRYARWTSSLADCRVSGPLSCWCLSQRLPKQNLLHKVNSQQQQPTPPLQLVAPRLPVGNLSFLAFLQLLRAFMAALLLLISLLSPFPLSRPLVTPHKLQPAVLRSTTGQTLRILQTSQTKITTC